VTKRAHESFYHLTLAVVQEIHAEAIGQFGGSAGVRDLTLLESAVAAPQAGFGGAPVYRAIAEVAGAYLFFLCRNHPFIDGNKRAALGACIVFLRLNGGEPRADGQEWEDLTLGVASSGLSREQATERLRALIQPSRQPAVTPAMDVYRSVAKEYRGTLRKLSE
jgi:death on curing protein